MLKVMQLVQNIPIPLTSYISRHLSLFIFLHLTNILLTKQFSFQAISKFTNGFKLMIE